jgi:hypothetical protein
MMTLCNKKKYKDVVMRSSPCFAKMNMKTMGIIPKNNMKVMVLHVKMIKPCESSLGGVV